jgi:hypothetical protein
MVALTKMPRKIIPELNGVTLTRVPDGWSVNVEEPTVVPAFCLVLQRHLAPPNEKKAEEAVKSLIDVINKKYIKKNKAIPEEIRRELTKLNERLNVLRYSALPKEWTQ